MKSWIATFTCCFNASGNTAAETDSLRASSPLRRLGQHPGAVPARPALSSKFELIAQYDQSPQGVLLLACQPCSETVCIPYINPSAQTLLGLQPEVFNTESELQSTDGLLALFGQKESALLQELCAHLVRIADGNTAGNVTMYIAAQSLPIDPPFSSTDARGRIFVKGSNRMFDRECEDTAGGGKSGQPTRSWHHAIVEPAYFDSNPTPGSSTATAGDSLRRADMCAGKPWCPSGAGDPLRVEDSAHGRKRALALPAAADDSINKRTSALPAVLVTFHPAAPSVPHSPKELLPSGTVASPTTVATTVSSLAPLSEGHIDFKVTSLATSAELLRYNDLKQGAQKQHLHQSQPQQQQQQAQEQPRDLTLKPCPLAASARSSPGDSGISSTRLALATRVQQQGLLDTPGAPGVQPDQGAFAEEATVNALWLRERMVLSGLTPIVTAVRLDGREILYQNAASVAYYGPRPQPLPDKASSLTPTSMGMPCSFDDSADDSLWRALFSMDAGKLSRMKAVICDEGRVWKGIVQVPLSCSAASLSSVPGGVAEMGGAALKDSAGPQLQPPPCTYGRAVALGLTDACVGARSESGGRHLHPPSGPTSPIRFSRDGMPPTAPSTASLAVSVRRLRHGMAPSQTNSGVSVGPDACSRTAPLSFIGSCGAVAPTAAAAAGTSQRKVSEADRSMSMMSPLGSIALAVMQFQDIEACASAQRLPCVADTLATSTWGLFIEATELQGGSVGAGSGRAGLHQSGLHSRPSSVNVFGPSPAAVPVANVNISFGNNTSASTAATTLSAQGSTAGNSARGYASGGDAFHRCSSPPAAPIVQPGGFTVATGSASGASSRRTLRTHSTNSQLRFAVGLTGSAERIGNAHVRPGDPGSALSSSQDTDGLDCGTRSQKMDIPQRRIRPLPCRFVSRENLGQAHSQPSGFLPGVLAFASSLSNTPTVGQAALQQAIASSGAADAGGVGGTGATWIGGAGSSCRQGRALSVAASSRASSLADNSCLISVAQVTATSLERGGYNPTAACSWGSQETKPAEASAADVPGGGAPSTSAIAAAQHARTHTPSPVFVWGSSAGRQAVPGRSGRSFSGRLSRRVLHPAAAGFGGRSHRTGGPMWLAARELGAAVDAVSAGAALGAGSSSSACSHGTSQTHRASVGAAADTLQAPPNAAGSDAAVSKGDASAAPVARSCGITSFGSDGEGCSGASAMELSALEKAQPRPELEEAGLCVEVGGGSVADAAAAVEAVTAAVGCSQPLRSGQSLGASPLMTGRYCWHEMTATRTVDPITGQYAVLVTQVDVTSKVEAERHLAFVSEAEHQLLKQIFPRHVLAHLTEEGGPWSGHLSASSANVRDVNKLATSHPNVTLLFADIEGFTPMCKVLEPRVVMAFLNDLFTTFDRMLDDFGVYKMETIGDCYFVVGGLIHEDEDGMAAVRDRGSKEDPLHAEKVLMFAKAMLAAASRVILPTTGTPVRMRVGIHSGPVVSGVVGERMPRFCLFGDTVNTASRMESTGVAGCIHASEAAYRLLRNEIWVPTGGIEVKGKGLMETYLWAPPDHDSQAILTSHLSARSSTTADAAAGRTTTAGGSNALRDGTYGNVSWSTRSSMSPATVDIQPTALSGSASNVEGGVRVGGGGDGCAGGGAGGGDAVRPFVVVQVPAGGGGGDDVCARLRLRTSGSSLDTVDVSILGLVRDLLPGKGM